MRVHRLFLFGSRARGDSHAGSDMDVLVVLDDEPTGVARDYVGNSNHPARKHTLSGGRNRTGMPSHRISPSASGATTAAFLGR